MSVEIPDPVPDYVGVYGMDDLECVSVQIEECWALPRADNRPIMAAVSTGGYEAETVWFDSEGLRDFATVLNAMADRLAYEEQIYHESI